MKTPLSYRRSSSLQVEIITRLAPTNNLTLLSKYTNQSTETGGSNLGIPPLLKHACVEGDWLLCWHCTPAMVSHQMLISGTCISRMPSPSVNKAEPTLALKPRGDITRSPKQGYQWAHKWTCVQQNFLIFWLIDDHTLESHMLPALLFI